MHGRWLKETFETPPSAHQSKLHYLPGISSLIGNTVDLATSEIRRRLYSQSDIYFVKHQEPDFYSIKLLYTILRIILTWDMPQKNRENPDIDFIFHQYISIDLNTFHQFHQNE